MLQLFKALSDDTRLRILALLWGSELCVCEIEGGLGLTQSNASRHLTVLKNAGIVTSSKHAQWSHYRVDETFIKQHKDLAAYLAERLAALPGLEEARERASQAKQTTGCVLKACGASTENQR